MRNQLAHLGALLCLVTAPLVLAQDEGKPGGYESGKEQQPGKEHHFEPGKEHQLLKQFTGEWDFKMQCNAPGREATSGEGTQSAQIECGGFWLECEDKGMMSKGTEWTGKAIVGWNPKEKKYVGVWIDNKTPFMGFFAGEADSTGKVFTFTMRHGGMMHRDAKEGTPEAKHVHMPDRMVHEIQDKDHRTLKIYGKDEQGNEQVWTEVTFTRRTAGAK